MRSLSAGDGSLGDERAGCCRSPESTPANPSTSLRPEDFVAVREWLESLPLMAFIERGEEVAAANDLARRFIGSSESRKAGQIFPGGYRPVGAAERQRLECMLASAAGTATLVSGVVQRFAAAGDGARLVLLLEPMEDSADEGGVWGCGGAATLLEDLFDSAPEAMVIVQRDRILRVNRAFARLFECSVEGCSEGSLNDLILPEGRLHEEEMLLHGVEVDGRASMETVRRTRSGKELDVSVTVTRVRLGTGREGHLATYRDIRPEKEAQARLRHSALHDPLTGLANRVLFLDRLTQTMARLRRRPDRNFAVVFLDLDRFKQVNDTWGHAAGDRLLLAVAERLRSCLRPQDTVARFGGDEFALVLDEPGGMEEIECMAERIQYEMQRSVDVGGEVCISTSMGIALGSTTYSGVEDILRDADAAMYRAKETGRARHVFFTQEMRETPSRTVLQAEKIHPEAA